MTRKSVGVWTTRDAAEADRFERDLLGLPTITGESYQESASGFGRAVDFFDEIGRLSGMGRGQGYASPNVAARVVPPPAARAPSPFPIATEDWEAVPAPAPAAAPVP